MTGSPEHIPAVLDGNSAVMAESLRRPTALRLTELAVLLLRATALVLLLSPALIATALLLD